MVLILLFFLFPFEGFAPSLLLVNPLFKYTHRFFFPRTLIPAFFSLLFLHRNLRSGLFNYEYTFSLYLK